MIRPGFTGAAVDRADRLRLDEKGLAKRVSAAGARLLRLTALDPLLDAAGRLCWEEIAELSTDSELIFLGLDGDMPLFAPLIAAEPGQRAWGVLNVVGSMAPEEAALWGGARSLIEWHNRHLFCGRCGSGTTPFRSGWGRRCRGCGLEHFPRIDPVVIMLAEHDGRVLLGRQPQYPPRRFSALAGFVEPGESIEEAVARELGEEAGLEVKDIRYVASQPWPFPGQLMIACLATATDDRVTLDEQELEAAIWVDRDAVAAALAGDPEAPFLAPPRFAIAHTLLVHWMDGSQPLAAGATRL